MSEGAGATENQVPALFFYPVFDGEWKEKIQGNMYRRENKLLLYGSLILFFTMTFLSALSDEITVSAAASMKEAVGEVADAFAKTHPDVRIMRNFGASGALAKQIEAGAPADIFISANTEWMEYTKEKKLVDDESVTVVAHNQLVVIGRKGITAASMTDLPNLERIAIGSPGSVPAGDYAMKAMKQAGIDAQVKSKLIMAKDVVECLMYTEKGEVDAAFVYRTESIQAKNSTQLFAVPRELCPEVVYPMALTVAGAKNKDAAAFLDFLKSGEAKAVLTRHGFNVE